MRYLRSRLHNWGVEKLTSLINLEQQKKEQMN